MKKLQIVFILVICFLSFNSAHAESLIIPSTGTIDDYLEYRSGCNDTNILDCYRANSIENNAWSDVRAILNQIPKNTLDRRAEDIKKAREKLEKDNETNYKQLQAELKSLSASIDTNIKNGFYCVLPTQTCTESIYQSIRGIAISSGLTPDANQLAQCRAEIDEYNQKLQAYNKCSQDWRNAKIEDSTKEEYEYQLQIYKLKAELACMDKEGYYSSFNFETEECECEEGSTFINGKCKNEQQLRLDRLLLCVQTFGPLSYSDGKGACSCDEGSEFDWGNKGLCTIKDKVPGGNVYIPVAERQNTPKTRISTPTETKPSPEPKITEEMSSTPETAIAQPTPVFLQENPTPTDQKTTLWQRLKMGISKLKFW